MNKIASRKLRIRKVTIGQLTGVRGGLRNSYVAGCSYSCNTCQENDACGPDTALACTSARSYDEPWWGADDLAALLRYNKAND
jgi:hypothetical protein